MLDKLAGRLTWERTGSGIRVEIPAAGGWITAFLCFWLIVWGGIGGALIARAYENEDFTVVMMIWSVAWVVGVCFGLVWMAWSITGRTTVTLSPVELEIRRRFIGMEWDKRTFATSGVRNFRYIPPFSSSQWVGGNYERTYHASEMRFEAGDKTRSFAGGVSDTEAFALIDKMLEVYPFPKDRALEYIGKP